MMSKPTNLVIHATYLIHGDDVEAFANAVRPHIAAHAQLPCHSISCVAGEVRARGPAQSAPWHALTRGPRPCSRPWQAHQGHEQVQTTSRHHTSTANTGPKERGEARFPSLWVRSRGDQVVGWAEPRAPLRRAEVLVLGPPAPMLLDVVPSGCLDQPFAHLALPLPRGLQQGPCPLHGLLPLLDLSKEPRPDEDRSRDKPS